MFFERINMIGFKNQYFEVIEFSGKNTKKGYNLWKCLCKCGNITIKNTNVLRSEVIKSCGCSKKGNNKGNKFAHKHGLTKRNGPHHPLYRMRNSIMTRCYNAKKTDYSYYQGKGIKVFQEWIDDPKSFYDWAIENGWEEGLTIDRIDSNKDYCPDNCQFLSRSANLKKMHTNKKKK